MLRVMAPPGLRGRVKALDEHLDWDDGATVQYISIACPTYTRSDLAIRDGCASKLRRLLMNLEERGCEIGGHTVAKAVTLFANYGSVKPAEVLYEKLRREKGTTPSAATAMTVLYGSVGAVTQMRLMMKQLEEMGVAPTIHLYNAALRCFSHTRNEAAAFRTVRALASTDIKPSRRTVLLFLSCCRTAATARGIIQSVEEGKWGAEVTICDRMFNSAISACGPEGNAATAWELLEEMKRQGLPRTIFTYNALLYTCRSSRNMKEVKRAFQAARDDGTPPDQIMYATIMGACCDRLKECPKAERKRWLSLAKAAFEQAFREGAVDSNLHFTSMAQCYTAVGDVQGIASLRPRLQQAGFPESPEFVSLVAECHGKHAPLGSLWYPLSSSRPIEIATPTTRPETGGPPPPAWKGPFGYKRADDWYMEVCNEAAVLDGLTSLSPKAAGGVAK